jgi:hypothetical protein
MKYPASALRWRARWLLESRVFWNAGYKYVRDSTWMKAVSCLVHDFVCCGSHKWHGTSLLHLKWRSSTVAAFLAQERWSCSSSTPEASHAQAQFQMHSSAPSLSTYVIDTACMDIERLHGVLDLSVPRQVMGGSKGQAEPVIVTVPGHGGRRH